MTRIHAATLLMIAGLAPAGAAFADSTPIVLNEPLYVAYPASAFDRKEEGKVGVELAIASNGAVEGCTVVKPVSQALDEASCAFWKRTRFRAAYNDEGQPVAAVIRKTSDWRLPPQ